MFMCAQQTPRGIVCCTLSGTKQLLQEGAGTSPGREDSVAGRQLPSPRTDSFALAEQSSPKAVYFFLSRQIKMFFFSKVKGDFTTGLPQLRVFSCSIVLSQSETARQATGAHLSLATSTQGKW